MTQYKKPIKPENLLLNGYPALDQFKAGYRLYSYAIFNRTRNGLETWLNPIWLEEILDKSPELEKLAKEAADLNPKKLALVQAKIFELFTSEYISGMIKQFKKVLPDLALYFAAGEDSIGLVEQIRREFNNGLVSNNPSEKDMVEDYGVHQL